MSQTATFEPVTLKDIKDAVAKMLPAPLRNIDQTAPRLAAHPARNTLALVGLTSLIFYMAERGHNPKVNSILDASIYCSTCLTVGFSDIFARTPVGKMIGTLLMTIGPSMANQMLDGTQPQSDSEVQQKILATLQEIQKLLEQQPLR